MSQSLTRSDAVAVRNMRPGSPQSAQSLRFRNRQHRADSSHRIRSHFVITGFGATHSEPAQRTANQDIHHSEREMKHEWGHPSFPLGRPDADAY